MFIYNVFIHSHIARWPLGSSGKEEEEDLAEEEGKKEQLEEEDDEEEEGRHCSISEILLHLAAKHTIVHTHSLVVTAQRETRGHRHCCCSRHRYRCHSITVPPCDSADSGTAIVLLL